MAKKLRCYVQPFDIGGTNHDAIAESLRLEVERQANSGWTLRAAPVHTAGAYPDSRQTAFLIFIRKGKG